MAGKNKSPMFVFPEGLTNNCEYLCRFKKGAFASLLPIQPSTLKVPSPMISLLPNSALFVTCCEPVFFRTMTVKYYPVFVPNEYFWKTHWEPNKEKEEKVDTYMRAIHEIMMKGGNLKNGWQWRCEDRFEYIRVYKGNQSLNSEKTF